MGGGDWKNFSHARARGARWIAGSPQTLGHRYAAAFSDNIWSIFGWLVAQKGDSDIRNALLIFFFARLPLYTLLCPVWPWFVFPAWDFEALLLFAGGDVQKPVGLL